MSRHSYDLAVAYRIYPGVSKTPFIHADNKLKLTETGLRTFRSSLGNLKVKIYFLLDGCPPEYEQMIHSLFPADQVTIIPLQKEGNEATFNRQIDLLLSQEDAELVFFAEDDYVYREGMLENAVQFLKEGDVDFITPYDHLDSYTLPIHTENHYKIRVHSEIHWRTAASTCLTFLTKKHILQKTQKVFRSYYKGNWDSSIWFALTKYNVWNIRLLLKVFLTNRFLFKVILLSWIKNPGQILFGKKYQLWQPLPSIATHMESISLAPNIDWNKIGGQTN